jgi:hypothetical protein
MAINRMGQMMKIATQSTPTGESIEQVKQRFTLWRAERQRGTHISAAFWAAAVGLVAQHGLRRVVSELGVDYGRLKKRFEQVVPLESSMSGAGKVQFVELFATPPVGVAAPTECIVEMDNGRGAKMRIELKNLDALAGLTSAFWSAR